MQAFFADVNWKTVAISVGLVFILLILLGRSG